MHRGNSETVMENDLFVYFLDAFTGFFGVKNEIERRVFNEFNLNDLSLFIFLEL